MYFSNNALSFLFQFFLKIFSISNSIVHFMSLILIPIFFFSDGGDTDTVNSFTEQTQLKTSNKSTSQQINPKKLHHLNKATIYKTTTLL